MPIARPANDTSGRVLERESATPPEVNDSQSSVTNESDDESVPTRAPATTVRPGPNTMSPKEPEVGSTIKKFSE